VVAVTEHTGTYGIAQQIPIPDRPDTAETLDWWLITAPGWTPVLTVNLAGTLWSQWLLCVVRLRDDVPGFPPPVRQFLGATHELMVWSLDPRPGPRTVERLATDARATLQTLQPQNVVLQVEATDDEMREVTQLCAHAVVDGLMCPESWRVAGGNRELTRAWLASVTKTLAHVRGEVHAP
jgi:hypothetical protein